ncbi:MAG TPA: DNA cytosine methyltransferase, partial [Chloroflexota bacterium]|nr:DNA cytosine methyltransferase [Chloroflexota bacterium]
MINPHAWMLSDPESIPSNGLKVMSTFSGGGGSSMGYKLAGCDVVAANDIDPEMRWHYATNLQPRHFLLCPVADIAKNDLPDEVFHLDILDGSPPCSTFSISGNREEDWGKSRRFREGQANQVLSDLVFDYLDVVDVLRPRVAVAENVRGMLYGNAKGYCKLIFERFREIGYRPQAFSLNAADCAVPQHRERVFFVAIRDDIKAPHLVLKPKTPWVPANEACADVQSLTPEEIEETRPSPCPLMWWPLTKPGESFADGRSRMGLRRSLFNHYRLDGSRPAHTLTANSHIMNHWDTCRKMTRRELIRLGSFPDDYQFSSYRMATYLIGMSVPP